VCGDSHDRQPLIPLAADLPTSKACGHTLLAKAGCPFAQPRPSSTLAWVPRFQRKMQADLAEARPATPAESRSLSALEAAWVEMFFAGPQGQP